MRFCPVVRRRIIDRLIGYLLRAASHLLNCVPETWINRISGWVGFIWFKIFRVRRNVILENLGYAFPAMPIGKRAQLGQAACTHLVRTILEFLRIPRYLESNWSERVRFEGLEHFDRAKEHGKGVLLVTGHLGSFELALAALAVRFGSLSVIVKAFPHGVDGFINAIRARAGTRMIAARGTTSAVLRTLRRNEVVVAVLDQNARRSKGVFVTFFGQPACTMAGAALIAVRSEAAVIGASTWRELDGTHVIRIDKEFPRENAESLGETIQRRTQQYTHFIEQAIREHPEQWLWPHKRFKTRPINPVNDNG